MAQGLTFLLATVEPRGRRRLRLVFDESLDVAAFVPALYTVTCTDGAGPSPGVVATYIVLGCPNTVELALSEDLVDGGLYSVVAASVPSVGGNTATGQHPVRIGEVRSRPTEGPAMRDSLRSFFGEDLVWDGDFVEKPDGDLATCSGLDVIEAQARTCVESSGPLWAPSRGARIRQFVDGSPHMLPQAMAKAVREVGKDDRLLQVSGELADNEIQLTIRTVGDQLLSVSAQTKAAQ